MELWPGRDKITSKKMSPWFTQESQILPVQIWNHRCIQLREGIEKTLSAGTCSVLGLCFFSFRAQKKMEHVYILLQQIWYSSWKCDRSIITAAIFKDMLGIITGTFQDIHCSGKVLLVFAALSYFFFPPPPFRLNELVAFIRYAPQKHCDSVCMSYLGNSGNLPEEVQNGQHKK